MVDEIGVAYQAYLRELHELIAAAECADNAVLEEIRQRISRQPSIGAVNIQVSPVLSNLLGAASAIQQVVQPRLFGSGAMAP